MLKKILSATIATTLLASSLTLIPVSAAENETTESTTSTDEIRTISTRIKNNIPVRYDQDGNVVDATSQNADVEIEKKIPSSYDLRDHSRVTSVKNQGFFGTCWDFASTASMESNILTKGLGNETADTLDLSEAGNTWYLHSNTTDLSSPLHGEYVEDPDKGTFGGNSLLVADSISSGYGTYPESLLDYDTLEGAFSFGYPEAFRFYSDYRLKDYIELDPHNIELVKEKIMENGAAYYTYDSNRRNYYRTEDGIDTYYDSRSYDEPMASGHAVTIIGWDDNFSKENFAPENRPEHDGAWLIKNSWGKDTNITGDPIDANEDYEGCFWASYESKLYDITQFEMQSAEKLENVYQHQVSALDYIDVNSASNIFTANGTEKLEQINFGNLGEADVNISIYKLDSNYTSPVDGTLLSSFDSKIEYTGTHSVDVPDDITLNKGDVFSVVIKDNAPQDNELYLKYKPEFSYSTEVAGKSFFMLDDAQWTDVTNESDSVSYMAIKAYTSNVTVDKSKLSEIIEDSKTFVADENVPQSELDEYEKSLESAKAVLADENATQISVNNAYYVLKGKQEALGKYCFYINSMEEFEQFYNELQRNNTSYKYIQLNTDLDFSGRVFEKPIFNEYSFTSVFNGNGHTIKNFTCKATEENVPSAFFAYADGATIKNVTFDNATSIGNSTASIIASDAVNTQFINCTIKNSTVQSLTSFPAATFAIRSTECSFIDSAIENCSVFGGLQATLVTIDYCDMYDVPKCKFENFTAKDYTLKATYEVSDHTGAKLQGFFYEGNKAPILTMTDDKYGIEEFIGKIESFEIDGTQHTYTDEAYIFDKIPGFTEVSVTYSDYKKSDFYCFADLKNKGLILNAYDGTETDVVIPSHIYDAPVIALDKTFNSENLVSITIPGTIKSISDFQFYNHNPLSHITLGEGIETIGKEAFTYCNLTNVVIPDSVRSIDERAFYGNNLKSIVLGKNIESIGEYALGYTFIDSEFSKIPNFVINGYAGTAAEKYAKENGFTFVDLSTQEPVIPEVSYEIGDVNLDGKITVLDATLIQKYLAGKRTLNEKQLKLADINGSSDVTIDDATQILKLIVKLTTQD